MNQVILQKYLTVCKHCSLFWRAVSPCPRQSRVGRDAANFDLQKCGQNRNLSLISNNGRMSCRGYIHPQDHFDGLIFGRVLLGARSLMHELALPPNYGGLVESKHEKNLLFRQNKLYYWCFCDFFCSFKLWWWVGGPFLCLLHLFSKRLLDLFLIYKYIYIFNY